MIVRCPDCRSKYEIAAEKIPMGVFKLRCPRCKAVFPVTPASDGDGHTEAPPAAAASVERARETRVQEPARSAPEPARAAVAAATGAVASDAGAMPGGAAPPRPRITDPALARRMARAMISEMVLNRRTERDEALLSQTVLSRFGPAIITAYDVYRDKIAADLPAGPVYFRDAVNEILGGGSPVL